MVHLTLEKCSTLHAEFMQKDYRGKLVLFDSHFKLIPFTFPAFDTSVSWYMNSDQLINLRHIFNEEKKSGQLLYQRTMVYGKNQFVFNIQPLQVTERNIFHSFVLEKFLAEKAIIETAFKSELNQCVTKGQLIEERIFNIIRALQWIPAALKKDPASFPAMFLRIFNNGLVAAGFEFKPTVKVRRKFIELYLYSQGLLLADHYKWLMTLKGKYRMESDPEPLSLAQKIALLQQVGVIQYLKKRDEKENKKESSIIISLITAEKDIHYSSVCELLQTVGTGKVKDPLTKKNSLFIKNQLSRFKG